MFYCGKWCVLLYYKHLFILRVLSMKLTYAITHIRLSDPNTSKLAQLDALADAYLHLCQAYTISNLSASPPLRVKKSYCRA